MHMVKGGPDLKATEPKETKPALSHFAEHTAH